MKLRNIAMTQKQNSIECKRSILSFQAQRNNVLKFAGVRRNVFFEKLRGNTGALQKVCGDFLKYLQF